MTQPPFTARLRRRALGLLFCVALLNYLDRNLLGILLPSIKAELDLSDTALGFITGIAFSVFYALMGIPIARLADRTARRKVIAVAMAVWSAMTAVCGLATTFWQLALARVLVGVGEAGATPPSHALIADLFPKQSRATALSVYALGSPVGIILGFLAAGWIAQTLGWRIALFCFGLPGIALAWAVFVFLPEPPRGHSDGLRGDAPSPPLSDVLRLLATKPAFIHNCIGSGLYALVWYGLLNWMPSFFSRTHHMPLGEIGTWLAIVVGVSQLVGALLGGVIGDRLAGRDMRWLMWLPSAVTLAAAPFYVFAFLWPDPTAAFLSLALPFFLGIMQSGPQHATTQGIAPPAMRATASATYLLGVNLIGGLGAQSIGILSDRLTPAFGDAALGRAMVIVSVAASAWSAVHFWLAARTLRRDFARPVGIASLSQ